MLTTIYAFIIDLILGDPYWFPHPIKLIGFFITKVDKLLRKYAFDHRSERIAGVVLLLLTIMFGVVITALPLYILYRLGAIYYMCGVVFFSYTSISARCLAYEANMVSKELSISLQNGRNRVAYIVGRDTKDLTEEEVIKATIETVAENTTDGIIAPLIYLLIGGPVLSMAYKCVSTLDSMVGYKNEKYINIGWASAKTDDILNYIPARIAGFIMTIAAFLLRYDYKNAYKILLRDHDKHQSPNSAWTEAAAAGALDIQLGGTHNYFGKTIYKPTIGENINKPSLNDISRMNKLMITTSILFMLIALVVNLLIN